MHCGSACYYTLCGFKVILKLIIFFFNKKRHTYLLYAVVLHRAALILLFLGPPPALLALPSCLVPPEHVACCGATRAGSLLSRCSVCPFTRTDQRFNHTPYLSPRWLTGGD